MTFLRLIFFGRINREVRQEQLNEKNPKFQIPKPKFQITNSQINFRETVSCLPFSLSQSLYSVFFLNLFTNDQWPMTNDNSQPYFSWSWKNKPPSAPRTAKWEKSQNPNSKSQIAKSISAKLSPFSLSQSLYSVFFLNLFTNDQWPMTILSLIFLGLGRLNRQVRQEPLNEKNPKSQITNHR